MAEYVEGFVAAYERFWSPYPRRMAEMWLRHFERLNERERSLLDVGCGTGVVAEHFAAAGYRVTALDVSEAMLARARERLAGRDATVLHADAADFTVPRPAAFALSTYDIPNHLGGLDRVHGYLRCVHRAVLPGGWFGFDLCTRRGLRADLAPVTREADGISVTVARGPIEGDSRPLHVRGEVRRVDGSVDRFATMIGNTAYPVADVLAAAAEAGWVDCRVTALDDLDTPVADPEGLDRVAVLCRSRHIIDPAPRG